MKVGDNLVWLNKGDEKPEGAKLIAVKESFSHTEYENEDDYHPMQTPASWKVYKTMYLYELN